MEKNFRPKIITGKYKGLQLQVADSARPVTDRVKKTLFDILGKAVQGTNVLDLFAGSGNLGIEALSQGAESATFIDIDKQAVEAIRLNTLKVEEPIEIVNDNYRRYLKKSEVKFDIIFLDPPFDNIETLAWNVIKSAVKEKGIIVFKSDIELDSKLERDFQILEKRKIGINILYFLQNL